MAREDYYDKQLTDPMIRAGQGATGWWLHKDIHGVKHATPMRGAAMKGSWKQGMTWTYEPAEVRAWLSDR